MSGEVLALPMECWRWIPGYEGIYQVSTRGRVRSVDRWVTANDGKKYFIKGRILRPERDKKGYLQVGLWRDGKGRRFSVHRLVAMAWLDNPENKPQVNHRDETRTNDVYNLEWVTAKENINWGTGIERRAASQSKAVLALDPKTGQVVKEFPSTMEAGRKGFNQSAVAACCRGKYGCRSYKGFVWRFKDDYDQENTWTPVKIGREAVVASLSKAVEAVDPETGQVVREFASINEAGRNGFGQGNICSCCRGERRTHRGYIWRYKES